MKRLIATAAVIASIGTASFAMVSKDKLPAHVHQQIVQMVPNADLDGLTTRQIAAIYGLFSKSENLRVGNDPSGQLKVILAWD